MSGQLRKVVLALLVGLAVSASACGGVPTEVEDSRPSGLASGGAVDERDPALLGSWFRRALATDAAGSVLSLETTWTFSADGSVQRRLLAQDLLTSIAEEMAAHGEWTTNGSGAGGSRTVTVRFTSPASTTLQFGYQLSADSQGTALLLDGIVYRRLYR